VWFIADSIPRGKQRGRRVWNPEPLKSRGLEAGGSRQLAASRQDQISNFELRMSKLADSKTNALLTEWNSSGSVPDDAVYVVGSRPYAFIVGTEPTLECSRYLRIPLLTRIRSRSATDLW
jgi:hypothetical protein